MSTRARLRAAWVAAGLCVCLHALVVHHHLRAGSDCGACGPDACPAYLEAGWRARLRRTRHLLAWPLPVPAAEPPSPPRWRLDDLDREYARLTWLYGDERP